MSTHEHRLRVEGMTCNGCEASLVRVLTGLAHVVSATADHQTGTVHVRSDVEAAPTDDEFDAAIERAGFRRVR